MKSLDDLKQLAAKFKKGPTDIVGVDVADDAINVVRIRKAGDGALSLLAAEVLPAVSMPASDTDGPLKPLALSSRVKGKYASISVGGNAAVIKLLSFPGRFDQAAEGKVVDNMGLDAPDKYRISYKLINEARNESRVLAVAVPETEAAACVSLFPSGLPAPFSVEVSSLAVLSAFLAADGAAHKEEAIGVIDFGVNMSTFALFNKGYLALIRRFNAGTNSVLGKVQETLGVDMETAKGIVSDGSFDISQSVGEVMEPLVKQLVVSRDFVERRENCQLSRMYASGALTVSRDVLDEIRSSVGIDVAQWNPLKVEKMTVADDAVPASHAGQEWRFAAAVGACLATLEGA